MSYIIVFLLLLIGLAICLAWPVMIGVFLGAFLLAVLTYWLGGELDIYLYKRRFDRDCRNRKSLY